MEKKIIVTISRQYGSGGREIGELVEKALGIPLYDKEIITAAAADGTLSEEADKAHNTAANSLLYTLAMGSNVFGTTAHFGYRMPLNDKLFLLQSDVIRGYARMGSCVVVGRCADYVLRDEKDILRIFVYADVDFRTNRTKERHPELKDGQVFDVINKTDKRRSSYYNFYTGNKWGKLDHYDMALNSSTLGIVGAAESIIAAAKRMLEE